MSQNLNQTNNNKINKQMKKTETRQQTKNLWATSTTTVGSKYIHASQNISGNKHHHKSYIVSLSV